jgi:hypothetical protein
MACSKEVQFGHEYLGGTCLDCGRLQETISYKRYEPVEKKKKELTAEQQLAEEIWLWFGKSKEVPFGMLMGMIKRKGMIWVRQCWREIVIDRSKNPVKTFKWKVAQAVMHIDLST